ncbi:MAG: transposase [Candidatus Shapirobacteria bacterium]|nr:transposase [Candidatus Shapirobacteria bacterium]
MVFYRKSIRLKGFDYSQNGYYFVTFCTWKRLNILGKIIDNKMVLNSLGEIIRNELIKTEKIRENVKIDVFQIMPNHVHLILVIKNTTDIKNNNVGYCRENVGAYGDDNVGAYCNTPLRDKNKFTSPKNSLGSIIRGIKSTTSKQIGQIELDGLPVWQRNYFEIIIKDETEYSKIKNYIEINPAIWNRDRNNLSVKK